MSATCELLDKEGECFTATIYGENWYKDSLWKYCENHWEDIKIAEIQHNGINNNGYPSNPVLISIQEIC